MQCDSTVSFECPNCKALVSTTVEVDWSAAKKVSDLTSHDETVVVVCPKCGTRFAAHVVGSLSKCTITLDDHPLTDVVAGAFCSQNFDDDEWLDYEPPDHPHIIFETSCRQADELLDNLGREGDGLINRMVFAHLITALEAYLADTLIKAVQADHRAVRRLLAEDTELAKEKFTLAQIAADQHFVKTKVLSYLRSVMWHNLPKVNALCTIVLRKDLFALLGEKDKAELLKAIEYRHDCVHRNGVDRDNTKLDVFTKEYIVHIGNVIQSLVQEIEGVPF